MVAEHFTPTDVWLVCGQPINPRRKLSGCTCSPTDPTGRRVQDALNRLSRERSHIK